MQQLHGHTQDVLWERDAQVIENQDSRSTEMEVQDKKTFLWKGYTTSYIKVQTQNTTPLFNQITPTKLDFDQNILWGTPL